MMTRRSTLLTAVITFSSQASDSLTLCTISPSTTSIHLHVNICSTDGCTSNTLSCTACQPVVKYPVAKMSIIRRLSGVLSELQMTGKWSLLMSQKNATCTAIILIHSFCKRSNKSQEGFFTHTCSVGIDL